ncbi:MAG TPA: alpha amylase C-terminal domain-containing protein [Desulfobacterales bacterium]
MSNDFAPSSVINRSPIEKRLARLLKADPKLKPYETRIRNRLEHVERTEIRLTGDRMDLTDFASGHEYFGLHFRDGQWVLREWAPNATRIFLVGDFNDWQQRSEFAFENIDAQAGIWEVRLPADRLEHGNHYRLSIHWSNGEGDRIPAYARRVVQDPHTRIFTAQVWRPPTPYQWKQSAFRRSQAPPLVYEAHVGMAQCEAKIGTFREFTLNILPRIAAAGYNTIQLMAVQEHPYYGSFGYQVSSFFAPSSRFGTPEELKALVDTAHAEGIAVVMDLIHSHAVSNEVEGLSRFDGTLYQYFHDGSRGHHPAWDSRCFDYGKHQVLHFLLSNCRYWIDEFQFDGFRLDGITSMLYHHHGLGNAFHSYEDYFDDSVDEDALAYLALANRLIHRLRPDAVTIAEDISGMPGLATAEDRGGYGFDYRFAMGIPDYWIRLSKDLRDEDWPLGHLWFELTNRRPEERVISYAESHDQALVGDQTLIFRLIGADMYDHMHVDDRNLRVDRGVALHKMIRLITLATAGSGYLNFMGNEFGHPEWIDFPREGNHWSYHYARRQWHLVDNPDLKYHQLGNFDRAMIAVAKNQELLTDPWPRLLHEHSENKVLAAQRAGLIFVFNFHHERSFSDYRIDVAPGSYRMILDSDHPRFGGHGRLDPDQVHVSLEVSFEGHTRRCLSLYLPTRTAVVLKREEDESQK